MVKELQKPISIELQKLIMNSFNPIWEGTLQIIKIEKLAFFFLQFLMVPSSNFTSTVVKLTISGINIHKYCIAIMQL